MLRHVLAFAVLTSIASIVNSQAPESDDAIRIAPKNSTVRGARVLRWEAKLTFTKAAEYVQQLDALGAYLAVPDDKGKIKVIRNLKERPVKPKYEDFAALRRVYFIDTNDLKEFAEELKLSAVPSALVIAIPRELEDALVEEERKFKNLKEEEIRRTVFAITFKDKKPVIKVVEQEPKRTNPK